MNRREMFKVGCLGAGLLATVGYLSPFFFSSTSSPPMTAMNLKFLSPQEAQIIKAIATVMLEKDLLLSGEHTTETDYAEALQELVYGVDLAIYGLPLALQEEIAQLFTLMQSRLFMGVSAGLWNEWAKLKPDDIEEFLASWQFSSLAILQRAYQALQELLMAAWYGQERAWAAMAYPGPPFQK